MVVVDTEPPVSLILLVTEAVPVELVVPEMEDEPWNSFSLIGSYQILQ